MGLFDVLSKAAGIVAAPVTGGASLAPMLIGAGLGAGKHFLLDKPAEEASRKQSAAMMRVSPWSGIKPSEVKTAPGLFASALQGGAMGATAGSALGGAEALSQADLAANAGAGPLSNAAFAAKQSMVPQWTKSDWLNMSPQGGVGMLK
jgi:hypothetical protein